MKLKKWLTCLSVAFVATTSVGAFVACDVLAGGNSESAAGAAPSAIEALYAQAQTFGYAGTLEEFTESIRGANGADGKDGVDGEKGKDGKDGADGKDGEGIRAIKLNAEGHLIVTLTSGFEFDLGKITGEQGPQGEKGETGGQGPQGEKGEDGRGIEGIAFNEKGELVVSYTDGTSQTIAFGSHSCVHSYSAWSVGVEATCTSMGYDVRICELCGDVDYRFNAYLGHVYGEWETLVSGAHSTQFRICEECGNMQAQQTHTYENGVCMECGDLQTKGLTYTETEGGYLVGGVGTCRDTEIYIPQTYEGKPVLGIAPDAFYGHTELTKVVMPEGITEIGAYAFYGPYNEDMKLKSVTLPKSLKSVGMSAFANCSEVEAVYYQGTLADWFGIEFEARSSNPLNSIAKLYIDGKLVEDVIVPEEVTEIGNYAFCNYCGLKSITIHEGMEKIGGYAFQACKNLKSVYYTGTLTDWLGISFGNNYLFSNGAKLYIDGALLEELAVSDEITKIGAYTFRHYEYLKSVTLHDDVETIGNYAFANCTNLTGVTLGNGLKEFKEAFWGCTGLETIVIPDGVERIDDYAFAYSGVKNVTIGAGVKTIGNGAFRECGKLESIAIPDNVETIGRLAFFKTGLTSLGLGAGVKTIDLAAFGQCKGLQSVVIPDSVETLEMNAFYLTGLTSLTIGKGIKEINGNVFRHTLLQSVTIPDNVEKIYHYAFSDCAKLTSVTLGKGIKTIELSAFSRTNLQTIYYTGTLTEWFAVEYGDDIFDSGAKLYIDGVFLEELVVPGTVAEIRDFMFENYVHLKSVAFEKGVTSIGRYAFANCTGLQSVTIASSVNTIGKCAFKDCTALTGVTFENASGWSYGSRKLSETDLKDRATAATYLTATYAGTNVSGYDWTRTKESEEETV